MDTIYNMEHFTKGKKGKRHRWISGWIGTVIEGEVEEGDIYEIVKLHSRWIDRLNPQKMYMMSGYVRDALNIDDPFVRKLFSNWKWKFYGRKHTFKIPAWDYED